MSRPRKLPEYRQNRETKNVILAEPTELDVPTPPVTLKAKAKRQWEAFWRSPVAGAVDLDSDGFAIERWIAYVNEWYECTKALDKEGYTVKGSQGQAVINPLARHRAVIEAALSGLEKQLGLTPTARAQLGISVNALQKSAVDTLSELQTMQPAAIEDE